ncbi:hypothetical protein G210_2988 [Candida maltosa Xu316]|uniref:Uncharacterized protein n=1 Tax=Candida maltosa (strain Xu316) TaxID=1245528 RepID=M3JV15_CANMX|nr:hypothetical protein G210_2988 [Candida maltosa Xu316]
MRVYYLLNSSLIYDKKL